MITKTAVLLSLLITPALVTAQDAAPVVQTTAGAVQGAEAGGVRSYLGIPFAEPPVGGLRFRPPAPVTPWEGTRPATELPPACPQAATDGGVRGAEDCLYLNVWARSDAAQAPVMVFIHGGGNVQGSTSNTMAGYLFYDGGRIAAAKPVVAVTVQYRLGALGYLAHPALRDESEHASTGNYGLLDLVAALQWVRDNIAAFGGDPNRVMIFGESAGAINTCMMVASPLASGLFSAALMQSGVCLAQPLQTKLDAGVTFATNLGCDSAECLRQLPVDQIIAAQGDSPAEADGTFNLNYGPIVDGWVLPKLPLQIIKEGGHNRVPFVVGSNSEETGAMILPLTEAAYRAAILKTFGAAVGALVLRQYPASDYDSPRQALVAVTTDAQFTCSARSIARAVSASQPEPAYRYFFTRAPGLLSARGAVHGLELVYVFQHVAESVIGKPAAEDLALESGILDYWSSLAINLDPNNPSQPAWPRYDAASDPYLELGATIQPGDGVRTAQCDFWERIRDLLPNANRTVK